MRVEPSKCIATLALLAVAPLARAALRAFECHRSRDGWGSSMIYPFKAYQSWWINTNDSGKHSERQQSNVLSFKLENPPA